MQTVWYRCSNMNEFQQAIGELTAGETLQAVGVSYPDYIGADGWTLQARLAYNSQLALTSDGVADSDLWDFTTPFATTENLEPGTYQYVVYAEKDGVRKIADSGRLKVFANPGAEYPDAILLAAINSQLSSTASTEQRTTKIGDVELQFMSSSDLFKAQQYYERRLSKRRRKDEMQRGRDPNTILSEYR